MGGNVWVYPRGGGSQKLASVRGFGPPPLLKLVHGGGGGGRFKGVFQRKHNICTKISGDIQTIHALSARFARQGTIRMSFGAQ